MCADAVIVSCEHASACVPDRYRRVFRANASTRLLASHRAYDIGAEAVAVSLSDALSCPLFVGSVTRLLIDLNRSPRHRAVFSEYARRLTADERHELLARYYLPFRARVHRAIRDRIARGRRVIHLSVHSFTPRLSGVRRDTDIGLLYDPARPGEAAFAASWQARLQQAGSLGRVRRNYPYRGVSDGHTTALRKVFDANRYVGIELELNQLFFRSEQRRTTQMLVDALVATMPREQGPKRGI